MSILIFQHISFVEMTLFLFLFVFWGICPRRRTLGGYARGRSSYLCSFLHCIEKRIVYVQVPCTCGFSLGSGTPHPWVALPQENPLGWEPPVQHFQDQQMIENRLKSWKAPLSPSSSLKISTAPSATLVRGGWKAKTSQSVLTPGWKWQGLDVVVTLRVSSTWLIIG